METPEENLRVEAVKRYLQGEGAGDIARELGRSRAWVHKWVRRYEEGLEQEDKWYRGLSRAPHNIPAKTGEDAERMVVEARRRLEGERYLQVGASAIQEELRRLGVEDIPQTWTINRILARHGMTRKNFPTAPRGYLTPRFPAPDPTNSRRVTSWVPATSGGTEGSIP